MPACGVINLADANVWLAVAFSDHVHHRLARNWFEARHEASCAFRRLTQAPSPSHALWTDAYLAAFAVESRAHLVSFDRGISRFSGLDFQVLTDTPNQPLPRTTAR